MDLNNQTFSTFVDNLSYVDWHSYNHDCTDEFTVIRSHTKVTMILYGPQPNVNDV